MEIFLSSDYSNAVRNAVGVGLITMKIPKQQLLKLANSSQQLFQLLEFENDSAIQIQLINILTKLSRIKNNNSIPGKFLKIAPR